ncbi:MAG: xanthine dehydrogenase family protein molybdopterin-binding subunit [Alphaproteobacteria bacterium]|nr:xanthine dehydrogenase family protein molybdopterin-binding subunit [Alphaproteobacteria bacterium]
MMNPSRRGFLGGLSGLVVAFHLPGCRPLTPPVDTTITLGSAIAEGQAADINAWIRVAPNGVVTLQMGASEMGQGVYTALPMILAEELDCDWAQVRAESAPAHDAYRRELADLPGHAQLTGGSESVRGYWSILREAGAQARAMLIAAAAARWGVDPSTLRTEAGFVLNGEERLSYGELAHDAAQQKVGAAPLKSPEQFRIIGTSPERLDLRDKSTGRATFGVDVQVEGALVGAVKHCPHHGGALVSFDATDALALDGVVDAFQVDDDKVVVVADTFWQAKRGADALKLEWDPGEGAGLDDAEIGRRLQEALDGGGKTLFKLGKLGETTLSTTYEVPYLEHAPLEPLNATAWVQPDRVDVWAPTQAQGVTRRNAAKIAGLKQEQAFVHTTLLGGGFGRKGFWDFTDLAVKVSKHLGAPVKVLWTREECFTRGYYRPRVLCRQSAAIGPDGLPTDWHIEMAGQSIMTMFVPALAKTKLGAEVVIGGMSHMPYAVPNQRVDYAYIELPIPIGWWRSVQGSTNGFFRECFLDEIAAAGGQDPIELRRRLLADNPRYLRVFEAAVEAAGDVSAGLSRGVALFESFGSISAQVCDIEVIEGRVLPRRVTASIDCGRAIHPDNTRAQVMGALTMGLSAALYGGLSFKDGAAQQLNFHSYTLMGMAQAPEVEVVIVDSGEELGGVGEPGLPPIAGALCNAIFAATGKRITTLPVGNQLVG